MIPDDILIKIVSRLPTKDVHRWKCVSKYWRNSTSTLEFRESHLQGQCNPMILVKNGIVNRNLKEFLDEWWDLERERSKVLRFMIPQDYKPLFSQAGLLLLKYQSDFVILNPINGDKVRIIPSETLGDVLVHGIFWSSNLKEYCVMFTDSVSYEFTILNLGPEPCSRKISTPWDNKLIVPTYPNSALVGEYLYRLVIAEYKPKILEYNVRSEEFTLILYPDVAFIQLLNIDGQLSIVRVSGQVNLIIITKWALTDRVKHSWVPSNYYISCQLRPSPIHRITAVAYAAGILIWKHDQTLFVCDMKTGSGKSYVKYCNTDLFVPHVMSLASLGDCKSEIVIY